MRHDSAIAKPTYPRPSTCRADTLIIFNPIKVVRKKIRRSAGVQPGREPSDSYRPGADVIMDHVFTVTARSPAGTVRPARAHSAGRCANRRSVPRASIRHRPGSRTSRRAETPAAAWSVSEHDEAGYAGRAGSRP